MPPDPVRVRSRRRRPTRRRLFYTPGVGPSKAKKRLASITPREAADHCDSVSGSGAVKLASSAVVPLVAAARGYTSVTPQVRRGSRQPPREERPSVPQLLRRRLGCRRRVHLPWASIDGIPATEEQMRAWHPAVGDFDLPRR